MLRDNLVGLIEPMLSSAGAYTLALGTARKQSSDDRPPCLENPRPEGSHFLVLRCFSTKDSENESEKSLSMFLLPLSRCFERRNTHSAFLTLSAEPNRAAFAVQWNTPLSQRESTFR